MFGDLRGWHYLRRDTIWSFTPGAGYMRVCTSMYAHFDFWSCLKLSRRRPLSYKNQSIDLLCKSVDWFLYDNGLRLERVKFIIGKKKIIGTCFESGLIFRNFEFYNNVINCAKLMYSTMDMFMLASFKHFKMRFFLDSQCKVWRKHHYVGLKD